MTTIAVSDLAEMVEKEPNGQLAKMKFNRLMLSGTHNTLTGSEQPFRSNANEDKELNRGKVMHSLFGGASV